MNTSPTQRQAVLAAIREAVYLPDDLLTEATPIGDLALDSIDYVELLVVLNTRFHVPVNPGAMDGVVTVGDLVDHVLSHVPDRSTPSMLTGY